MQFSCFSRGLQRNKISFKCRSAVEVKIIRFQRSLEQSWSHVHTQKYIFIPVSSYNVFLSKCSHPTLNGLLCLLPLQLHLHHGGGGGDDGGRGQDRDTGGSGGRDSVGPKAPLDQLKMDRLAGVSEHFHCLLIGESLDVYTVHLQRKTTFISFTEGLVLKKC